MIYDLDGMLPARAFQRDARGHIKPQGGGGPSAPTNQNVTTTSIPEYARPYVEKSLGQAAALTDISQNPYQAYGGQRTAAFTPMQAQAMQNVSGMQTAGQLTDASNLAYTAGQQGLGAQQNAMGLQNTALGYGQAGAGYGAAASQFGAEGAQQAQNAALRAQRQASMYGSQGAQYGAQGAEQAAQAQRVAEGQADMYGQMGAGYGAQASGLAPEAQRYGAGAAQMGQQGMGIGQRGVSAAEQGFQAQQDYQKMATSPEAQQAYMSPYMQNVVDVQSKEARRQADISQQGNKSRAVAAGAFGGNRAALVEAESERGLQDRLAGIQAQGSQSAFEKAQQAQQFGSNLGIQGLQAGYQGLQAGMQGTGQGIQGQEAGMRGVGQAGQMYGLGMQGAGLGLQGTGQRLAAANVGLAGTNQGIQGAGLGIQSVGQQIAGGQLGLQGAQAGIQGQQAGMQGTAQGIQGVQAATGAGQYGLQGTGAANQSASTLGQIGQTQFGQETAITDAQMKAGQMQQSQEQKGLDLQYQQYQDSLNYPYKQLGFMSDMYRGLPLSQSSQSMYQNPSAVSQAVGLGTAGYGLYQMGKKEGGLTKSMANGGITQLFDVGGSVKSDLSRMSPQELQEYIAKSSSPTAKKMAQEILAEKAFMAKQQQSAGVTQLPSNLPVGEAMAGGGIVAFAAGDQVESSGSLGSTRADGEARTDTESILARLIAGTGEGDNTQPIPGSEMAQAAPTSDANPVATPVSEPVTTASTALPPLQAAGVDSLVAKPPTRLPDASAPPATVDKSVYGGMPLMSPEAKEAFSQYAGMYKDMRGDNKKAREEAKYMALIQAGFGIAGGTSPNAFANINQGVQPAIAQYQSAIKDIRKEDREAIKGLIDLGLNKEQFLQKVQQMGIDVYKADKVFEAHKYSADASVRAAQARTASEKRPTDQESGVNDYVAAARLDPANKGKSDEQLRVEGRILYLTHSRPQQPNASIATAITGSEKEDSILSGLEVDLWRARNDPAKKKAIQAEIDERKKFIAGKVTGQSSAGRGLGTEVPGIPNASAEASAAAKWAKVPVPPVPKEVPIAPDKWAMAVGKLRLDPSPTNKKYFDAQFGEGASDRALKK